MRATRNSAVLLPAALLMGAGTWHAIAARGVPREKDREDYQSP